MSDREVRNSAAIGLTAFVMTVLILRLIGRTWWCSCGSPVPWSWEIWSSHNSQHLIDPYTFTHALHGLVFFAALRFLPSKIASHSRFLIALTVECAWEILENSPMIIERYREATISLDYYGDSIANSLFDIVACMAGYLFASKVRWWWSLALFAVIEVILLMTIRDCLILNVVMLVWPIEAIKQWQGG